jgi:hypothetical protein
VPVDATAVALNVTAVSPSRSGHLEVRGAGATPLGATTLSVRNGVTLANNAIVALGVDGEVAVFAGLGDGGATHLVIDVAGYFR